MATKYIKCCGKLHEVIQFTTKGPIQYGAECSVCGKRVAVETPKALRDKWNPKPLDAGLAERLKEIYLNAAMADDYNVRRGFRAVANYVRKIVKEATKQKENRNESNKIRKSKRNHQAGV